MEFKLKEEKDYKMLGEIWTEWMTNGMDYTTYWKNLFENLKDNLKVYGLYKTNMMIGLIAGTTYSSFLGERVGHILHIFILLDHRSLYNFKLLTLELQNFFKEKECNQIIIELGTNLEISEKLDHSLKRTGYQHIVNVYKRGGNEIW